MTETEKDKLKYWQVEDRLMAHFYDGDEKPETAVITREEFEVIEDQFSEMVFKLMGLQAYQERHMTEANPYDLLLDLMQWRDAEIPFEREIAPDLYLATIERHAEPEPVSIGLVWGSYSDMEPNIETPDGKKYKSTTTREYIATFDIRQMREFFENQERKT